uniref:Uncharacterized protein n=1 Tax=Panagrolaimus sp. ES5 TaxID=591445 RepID=A0AC34GV76_9BILA
MDSTPYKLKLRSYSRLSQGEAMHHSQQKPYKTPMQRRSQQRGKNRSPPPTPRAHRSMCFADAATPSDFNSSLHDVIADETPKRKSARKSRLSEAPHLVTPHLGYATKSCQTDEFKTDEHMKKLREESRKIKQKRDMVNQTAKSIRQQARDFAQHVDEVTGALDNI